MTDVSNLTFLINFICLWKKFSTRQSDFESSVRIRSNNLQDKICSVNVHTAPSDLLLTILKQNSENCSKLNFFPHQYSLLGMHRFELASLFMEG